MAPSLIYTFGLVDSVMYCYMPLVQFRNCIDDLILQTGVGSYATNQTRFRLNSTPNIPCDVFIAHLNIYPLTIRELGFGRSRRS